MQKVIKYYKVLLLMVCTTSFPSLKLLLVGYLLKSCCKDNNHQKCFATERFPLVYVLLACGNVLRSGSNFIFPMIVCIMFFNVLGIMFIS